MCLFYGKWMNMNIPINLKSQSIYIFKCWLPNSGENEEDIIKKEKEDTKPKFTIFDIEEAQRKIFTSSSIDVAMLEGRDQSR